MKPSAAVSLLLTNLQLLDYYSSAEVFPISAETFTSLKNKGKAFEHIVHHLFQVYQPAEASNRFHGCWPIYEPVQSRELRNVVYKWLTDLKRGGQLQNGGSVIIRRSLFDDCCGERYEELLLALSTMVLKDQVERGVFKDSRKQTIAYKQSTTHTPSLGLLTPLILAHQSFLSRLLASRNTSKAQWNSFLSVVKLKEEELALIASQLALEPQNTTDLGEKEAEILAKWKNNWLGDERWLDILVNGDPEYKRDRFLEMKYDKALAKHRSYAAGGEIGKTAGAVAPLTGLGVIEKQVEEQKRRVDELRVMREAALNSLAAVQGGDLTSGESLPGVVAEKKGLPVNFTRHLPIRVTRDAKPVNARDPGNDSYNEYSVLLEDLRAEVEAVDTVKRRRRPRSVVMPYHSHSFSNDNPLGMGAEAQGISHIQPPRKTFLPQPLSKGARPGIGIQRSSFKQPDVSTVSSVQDTNVEGHETEGIARAPSANQSETGISYQRKAIPITRPVKQEPDHSTFASSPTKVSLFDNMILLPPKPSLGPSGFEEMNKQSERPQSVSSTLSDEQFSDVDASFMMTPRRTGGFTASPQPSQPSSSGNDTPIRTRGFTVSSQSSEPSSIGDETPKRSNRPTHKVEDHEMTPRPLRYSRLPRKDSVSKISSSYDESELVAEKVVLC